MSLVKAVKDYHFKLGQIRLLIVTVQSIDLEYRNVGASLVVSLVLYSFILQKNLIDLGHRFPEVVRLKLVI